MKKILDKKNKGREYELQLQEDVREFRDWLDIGDKEVSQRKF